MLSISDIDNYLRTTFSGLSVLTDDWGETSYFYNPDGAKERGQFVFTIKKQDSQRKGTVDVVSDLDREGIYRINFRISKNSFTERFGAIPSQPSAGNIIPGDYDFAALNVLMPHPTHAHQCWVVMLNPSPESFESLKSLISESYKIATERSKVV